MLDFLSLLAVVPTPPAPSQAYQFWLQIITLVVAAFLTWDARRSASSAAKAVDVASSTVGDAKSLMHELKITVNGRISELLATSKVADHAAGVEAGRAAAVAEVAAVPSAAATAATAAAAAVTAAATAAATAVASATARDERAADAGAAREIRATNATAAREIRMDDFTQAHANTRASNAATGTTGSVGATPTPAGPGA